jgi:hypothetical protein
VVVVFDSVPPPLTVQVTPAEFLSWVTVAVRVVESVPSTVVAAAVTVRLIGFELPPQPVNATATKLMNRAGMTNELKNLVRSIVSSFCTFTVRRL